MSPYYEDDLVTLWHGRCEDVLPSLGGVAATFTSPPYNTLGKTLAKASGMYANNAWRAKVAAAGYADDMTESDYAVWQYRVSQMILGASLPTASFFYNHKCRWRNGKMFHPIDYVRAFDGWTLRQELIWDRNRSMTFNARLFPVSDERIYWMVRGDYVWNQEATRYMSVWKVRPHENEPDHPCPFPEGIVTRALVGTTSPGDVVLDPFAGTGTTLRAGAAALAREILLKERSERRAAASSPTVAEEAPGVSIPAEEVAKDMGRRAIGIEMNERYCEIAARRLAQDTLFGGVA